MPWNRPGPVIRQAYTEFSTTGAAIVSRSLGPLSADGAKAAPNSAGSLLSVADHHRANMLPPQREPKPRRLRALPAHLRNRWQEPLFLD